jgi:hypothetical protein
MLDKNPAVRITWEDVVAHPWWGQIKIDLPDFPEQVHFENFLEKYGYMRELDERNRKAKEELQNTDEPGTRMKSENIRSKSAKNNANLLRMSLNVGNNLRI